MDDSEFKKRFGVFRETFEYILNIIRQDIQKPPTNLNPFPTTPEHQLAITLYRLAHGCSFSTVGDLFQVSESLADKMFSHVVRLLVARLYSVYVKLPLTEEEWGLELRGFIALVLGMAFMSMYLPS